MSSVQQVEKPTIWSVQVTPVGCCLSISDREVEQDNGLDLESFFFSKKKEFETMT